MISPPRIVDRVTRTAPFGFRLWDPVARRAVTDGLVVKARDRTGRERPVEPARNGVFSIRGLPIAMPFVAGAGDDAFWADAPELGAGWEIRVTDPGGRYLPFRFRADGALRIGPVAREVCRIAPGGGAAAAARPMPDLPLFAAPGAPAPASAATVTMDLRTTSGLDPAGTLVEVVVPDGPTAFGLADPRGSVRIDLPYPPPPGATGTPPTPPRLAMSAVRWTGVRIRAMRDLDLADPAFPDLCAVLSQADNPDLPILASEPPSGPLGPQTIEFGRPLVVRTTGLSVALLDTGAPPNP